MKENNKHNLDKRLVNNDSSFDEANTAAGYFHSTRRFIYFFNLRLSDRDHVIDHDGKRT